MSIFLPMHGTLEPCPKKGYHDNPEITRKKTKIWQKQKSKDFAKLCMPMECLTYLITVIIHILLTEGKRFKKGLLHFSHLLHLQCSVNLPYIRLYKSKKNECKVCFHKNDSINIPYLSNPKQWRNLQFLAYLPSSAE